MDKQLADIATEAKEELNGFKVLGVFPFYLSLISTRTQLKLCGIKACIREISEEQKVSDFDDPVIMNKAVPLINKYIVTALLNDRLFSFIFRPFLKHKVDRLTFLDVLNLYKAVTLKNNPNFFLTCWTWMNQQDHTLLKVEKPSLEK